VTLNNHRSCIAKHWVHVSIIVGPRGALAGVAPAAVLAVGSTFVVVGSTSVASADYNRAAIQAARETGDALSRYGSVMRERKAEWLVYFFLTGACPYHKNVRHEPSRQPRRNGARRC
jgi:hypothetical protein